MPISIGGDDGVTNPVIRGLDGLSDVTLIQIDVHLDWRDERYGIRDGYSSPRPAMHFTVGRDSQSGAVASVMPPVGQKPRY
jgi:arginase family enzyme